MLSIDLKLSPVLTDLDIPLNLYNDINDLYLQLANVVKQINRQYMVLQSPNGHYWRLTVSNAGVVAATDLGTNLP